MPQDKLYLRSVVVPARFSQPEKEIADPTLDDILASLPLLRDPIKEEDQTVLTANMVVFFAHLREAVTLHHKRHHRAAAIGAVDAMINLISRFEPGVNENLAAPLLSLYSALKSLDVGRVERILKPRRKDKGGNMPDSMERQDLIGNVVGTVKYLQWTGLPLKQAHKMVANTLDKVGFKARSGSVTARTVRHWCEKVSEDIGQHKIAAQQANTMLTAEHEAWIKSSPPDGTRKRVLEALETYAETSAGSILEEPPKPLS